MDGSPSRPRNVLAIRPRRAIIRRCRESLNRFRFALNARVKALHMMRGFALITLRSLCQALNGSRRVRSCQQLTEFPLASPNAGNLLEWAPTGRRVADRVPNFGALRPLHHWLNIEDQYELTFIRETSAPVARRVSLSARWPWTSARRAVESACKKNILAAAGGILWRKRKGQRKTSSDNFQRARGGAAFTASA